MKIKYSPCKSNRDTDIKVIDENLISIDGEPYEFDVESVEFPDIAEQSYYNILNVYRKDGELYLTVLRFYTDDCTSWDTGDYHEING